MKLHFMQIAMITAMPIMFTGCIGTAASVASLASSMYSMRDLFLEKEGSDMQDSPQSDAKISYFTPNEQKQPATISDKENIGMQDAHYLTDYGQVNNQLQQYYAYPTYLY